MLNRAKELVLRYGAFLKEGLINRDKEQLGKLQEVLFKTKEAIGRGKKKSGSLDFKGSTSSYADTIALDYKTLVNNNEEYKKYIHDLQQNYQIRYYGDGDLERLHDDYDFTDFERNKEELVARKGFLLTSVNKRNGKRALGLAYPSMVAMNYYFDEVYLVSIRILNHFFGVKTLEFLSDETLQANERLVKLLEYMETNDISDMHFYKITDIHYSLTARFRDTVMKITEEPPVVKDMEDLVRAILTEARVDPFTKMVETKALLQKELLTGLRRNFRVSIVTSTVGTSEGRSCSIRKLAGFDSIYSLEQSNYAESARELLTSLVMNFSKKGGQENGGIMIVSGATNSGKTTLLYTLLLMLRNANRRIITIENPVEITIPDVIQLDLTRSESAEEKNRLTIEKAKNIILRQDPDVSLVSEVRARDEMHTVFELANTGHLAFTTIHANNCRSTLKRIRDIGQIEKDTMNMLVRLIINQTLVRMVCQQCKGKGHLSDGDPCPKCNRNGKGPSPGASGRVPLYEIAYFKKLEVDDDITNFEKLKAEDKMLHITKVQVAEGLFAKGLISQETLDEVTGAATQRILEKSTNAKL